MLSGDGKVQTNKCLFIDTGLVCDLTVRQKSIYLAEQGGRSRPELKNWVSGRLSPSALSQLGMRVLHHPTRSVTSAGHTGGKSNGMSCTPQAPSLWREQACFGFTSRINNEEAPWWLWPDQGQYHCQQCTRKCYVSVLHFGMTMKLNIGFSFFWSKLLGSFIVCTSIKRRDSGLTFSPSTCFLTRKCFITFILIRDCGHRKTHMHFNLI